VKYLHKLLMGFSIAFLFVALTGTVAMYLSQQALKESIGNGFIELAEEAIDKIDRSISKRIEQAEAYAINVAGDPDLRESNTRFAAMDDVQGYIDEQEREWRAAKSDELTPFMQALILNPLSREIRDEFLLEAFYREKYGYPVFAEAFATNAYGAVVALSNRTSDYRQDDEEWWQKAKEAGKYVSDFNYDESAGVYSLDIAVRMEDTEGNFAGVFKAVLNIREIVDIATVVHLAEHNEEMDFRLLDREGRTITATDDYEVMEAFASGRLLPRLSAATAGFFTAKSSDEREGDEFISYAHSRGSGEYAGNGWILVIEHEKEHALQPIYRLRAILVIIAGMSVLVVVVICLYLYAIVSTPIRRLRKATEQVAKGNLSVKMPVESHDELGLLAADFKKMVVALDASRKELDALNKGLQNKIEEGTKEARKTAEEAEKAKRATLNMMDDLTEAMEKQKRLEKIKTEFLSVTSHELRTPITPMSSEVEMLLGEFFGKLTDEQKKSLELVQRNITHLDHLISDILDISKLESGNMKFLMKKGSLVAVLQDVVETMKIKANERNISLTLKADAIPECVFDHDRIAQVARNLVNNAIKFTDSGGEITVEAINQGDYALMKVSDTGIGILKEDQEKIFRPFVQVDSSMSRNYEGSGLGLAICKGIIANHNGRIWAESEIGKGSVFQFTIPYKLSAMKGEVELFNYSEEEALNRFMEDIKKKGYRIVQGKEKELLGGNVIDTKGKLRYDLSLKDLEEKGYITGEDNHQQEHIGSG